MSQFAQTNTGDFDLFSGNLTVSTDNTQNTAWKLANLFSFFKGEWFRDRRQGLPYIQYVLVSNPDLSLISQVFQKTVFAAPGVASIKSMDLTFLAPTRQLVTSFSVRANDGSTIIGGVGQPFIVDVKGGQ